MKKTDSRSYATGKRKTSVARLWLKPGKGKITVNSMKLEEYFSNQTQISNTVAPMKATNTLNEFDIFCTVKGGGKSGQAGAIKHGLAKALVLHDEILRAPLKKNGYLTRDRRKVERKKYGKHKARKSTQFSKR